MPSRNQLSKSIVVTLSCLGMLASQTAGFAAGPNNGKAAVNDVALGANATLSGRIIDEQGYPLSGATVTVHQGKTVVGKAVTDKLGSFEVAPLRAGVYQITAGTKTEVYRVWAENTAPPAASKDVLMVNGEQIVRGQGYEPGMSSADLIAIGLGVAGVTIGTIALIKANDTQDDLDALIASLAGVTP